MDIEEDDKEQGDRFGASRRVHVRSAERVGFHR